MSLFSRNVEAYKLDLLVPFKDIMSENVPVKYYMASGENGGVNFLIKTHDNIQELIFNREQAKFLVEQFQFYIGEDDDEN